MPRKKKAESVANKPKTSQPHRWPKGVSGNPAGRPKDGESWAAIIKQVGDMYPEDLLKFIGTANDLGRAIAQYPKSVQLKYLITARVFAALMFEPSAGLWNGLMERAEGKVVENIKVDPDSKITVEVVYANRKSDDTQSA